MLFGNDSYEAQAYSQVSSSQHEAKLSHELIAGAASYEAAKAYQDHLRASGQHVSHEGAKDLLAGFAGVCVDRLFETKGLDSLDRFDKERVKQDAKRRSQAALAQSGGAY